MKRHSGRWIPRALSVSVLYVIIGTVFSTVAGTAGPTPMRTVWRATAFLLSAVVFVTHLAIERRRQRALASSLHVAVAVAIGAFALALSANVHSLSVASRNQLLLKASLVIWPLMTGVPAFVVALAATRIGSRFERQAGKRSASLGA